jgi:hypothetical protein
MAEIRRLVKRGPLCCQYCRGVRFEQRLRDGIHSGAIVLAFRRWKRSQVVPGRRYRTGIDMVEVESVDVVEPSSVDAAQACQAGYMSAGELLAGLRGDPALPVYRRRRSSLAVTHRRRRVNEGSEAREDSMGSGSLGLAGAVAATVYDRPAVTRQEHQGLVADGAARLGAGQTGQLREHGAVVIFVGG